MGDQVDHGDVALLGGAALDGDEIRDADLEEIELLLHGLLRHLRLVLRHLERRPVRRLRLRLNLDGRGERPALLVGRRQVVLVFGHRDGIHARPGGRVPEPPADVALDGLCVQPFAPDPLHEQRHRHLALAEARDADGRREIGGGVLEGVVHLVRRYVDRQLDLVLG